MRVLSGVKAQHPDWTEVMVSAETTRRMAARHASDACG
jgi:hypothetical protein